MATTTTNFGWDIPQSTDLVKDGATAIAALGQDIDTAFVDFKGGTTGQVLKKTSGTDLDVEWGTASSGLTLINTTSFSGVASQSVNNVFSSTYPNYLVLMNMTTSTTMTPQFRFRTASDDTTSNYNIQHLEASVSSVTATRNLNTNIMGLTPTTFNGKLIYSIQILNPNAAVETQGFITTSIYMNSLTSAFYQNTSDQYTGFSLIASTGNITGTVRVYGYAN